MESPNEIFVFFTSKYSNACRQVIDKINFIAPHFNTKVIDIDNPDTRFIVKNATQYKFETVPAALLIYPAQNNIKKLEGAELLDLLNKGIEMVNQKIDAIQQQQEEQRRLEQASRKRVVEIDGDEEDDEPVYQNKTDIRQALNLDDEEDEEDEPPRRRKIGKTAIFPDKRFAPTDEDGMISNMKPLPRTKGEGHGSMARSSLVEAPRGTSDEMGIDRNMSFPPRMEQGGMMEEDGMIMDMAQMQPRTKGGKSKKQKSKKVSFVDDSILDVSEEPVGNENQGMSMDDILPPNSGTGRSRENQERSSAIKQNASALQAAREQIMKSEEGTRKITTLP
jgi:hypothetical protein